LDFVGIMQPAKERPREMTEKIVSSDEDFQDAVIHCIDCSQLFIWTAGEQSFFHDKGLKNPPKRCKPCKQAKTERIALVNASGNSGIKQKIEVTVNCAGCGAQTTVPFYPSQGRPVLCRPCFLQGRKE
jgi:CxxC-x17-CxxC domain-containing protein